MNQLARFGVHNTQPRITVQDLIEVFRELERHGITPAVIRERIGNAIGRAGHAWSEFNAWVDRGIEERNRGAGVGHMGMTDEERARLINPQSGEVESRRRFPPGTPASTIIAANEPVFEGTHY